MEYAPYSASPTGYVQRENADHEWEPVPASQAEAVEDQLLQEKLAAARRVATAGKLGAVTIRSARNEEIAGRLGLTGDELADDLAKPDHNSGTRRRISEEEFDGLMAELGLTPDEARARFSGMHWGQ